MAATEPFVMSEDAGRYFCDHLCVELVRESRLRPLQARFLHVTAIDDCPPEVQEARLQLYAKQVRVAVDWLLDVPMAAEC
jgi:pyrrolidone-carboxylate peptidase